MQKRTVFRISIRDWIVDKPDKGFLFPAFNDRSTDLHSVLYYTKKSEDLQPEMIDQLLGSEDADVC